MSEEFEQPDWVKYWDRVSVGLEEHINKNRIPEAEEYILKSFGFFSYMTEDISTKVTKYSDIFHKIYVLILELQDILRSTLINQQQLLLATSALNFRTAFEIAINLEFIYQHKNPEELIQRIEDFFTYEKIVGSRLSKHLDSFSEEKEKEFADKHIYWKNKKTGLLRDSAQWNGEGLSFKDIVIKLGREQEYYEIYKTTSKFAHGSPVIMNMYRTSTGMGCLTPPDRMSNMTIMCCHTIMEALMSFCNFFGVEFNEVDYRIIQTDMVKAKKVLENHKAPR